MSSIKLFSYKHVTLVFSGEELNSIPWDSWPIQQQM